MQLKFILLRKGGKKKKKEKGEGGFKSRILTGEERVFFLILSSIVSLFLFLF